MFRPVFLSENLRRHYLRNSVEMKPADGNRVSPVERGLSSNPRKSQLLYCHRLARLDPNPCRVPDFAVLVLMHVVKAGLTDSETHKDHYRMLIMDVSGFRGLDFEVRERRACP